VFAITLCAARAHACCTAYCKRLQTSWKVSRGGRWRPSAPISTQSGDKDRDAFHGTMANTGAEDHVEQAIRKLQSGALGSSSDLEAFCASSLRLLLSPPLTYVTLHDDLVQFSQCGKLCKFCRYLYASFGEDMAEAKERSKTKRGPEVTATISTVHIEERSKPVDRVQFSVRISEPYLGNSYFRRFELLCGGGT
jgi:hypothetical protein